MNADHDLDRSWIFAALDANVPCMVPDIPGLTNNGHSENIPQHGAKPLGHLRGGKGLERLIS